MLKRSLYIILLSLFVATVNGQINDWPVFRGRTSLTGYSDFDIIATPVLQWSFASGERTKSTPVISDGIVYFGTEKGTIIGITPDNKISWKFNTGSPVSAPPLVYNNYVITGSVDGILRSINKTSGILAWEYKTENQIAGSANYWESGSRSGIVVGSYDYFLHCIDPKTGKLLWKLETQNYINGTPAISGGNAIFCGCDGIVRITDLISGKESDTVEIGVYIASSPAVNNGKAYFGDYDGNLYNLDLKTRKVLWQIKPTPASGAFTSVPAVSNSYVVIGNEDKYLYCYDLSGKLKWSFRTNGQITGSAVIAKDKVLFGSNDGIIYLLNIADGKKLWSFNSGSPITGSPAITRDRFYFICEDGRLLAFGNKK